jgi:uncharacterized protein YjiS (DUF1127 family)
MTIIAQREPQPMIILARLPGWLSRAHPWGKRRPAKALRYLSDRELRDIGATRPESDLLSRDLERIRRMALGPFG